MDFGSMVIYSTDTRSVPRHSTTILYPRVRISLLRPSKSGHSLTLTTSLSFYFLIELFIYLSKKQRANLTWSNQRNRVYLYKFSDFYTYCYSPNHLVFIECICSTNHHDHMNPIYLYNCLPMSSLVLASPYNFQSHFSLAECLKWCNLGMHFFFSLTHTLFVSGVLAHSRESLDTRVSFV